MSFYSRINRKKKEADNVLYTNADNPDSQELPRLIVNQHLLCILHHGVWCVEGYGNIKRITGYPGGWKICKEYMGVHQCGKCLPQTLHTGKGEMVFEWAVVPSADVPLLAGAWKAADPEQPCLIRTLTKYGDNYTVLWTLGQCRVPAFGKNQWCTLDLLTILKHMFCVSGQWGLFQLLQHDFGRCHLSHCPL